MLPMRAPALQTEMRMPNAAGVPKRNFASAERPTMIGADDAEIDAAHEDEQHAHGRVAPDVVQAVEDVVAELLPRHARRGGRSRPRQAVDRHEYEEEADCVGEKRRGRAGGADHEAGRRGADHRCDLKQRLQGRIAGRQLLAIEQLRQQRLKCRQRECVGHAEGECEQIEMPQLRGAEPRQHADRPDEDGAARCRGQHDPPRDRTDHRARRRRRRATARGNADSQRHSSGEAELLQQSSSMAQFTDARRGRPRRTPLRARAVCGSMNMEGGSICTASSSPPAST